ncbi:MAG: hypothetical protein HRU19_22860 [Pseudobacteriovorax sp.]|nr:hypothetical protein [Pseudobacteriovorax sp.]
MLPYLIASSLIFLAFVSSCRSSGGSHVSDDLDTIVEGTISYPFYVDTDPIGQDAPDQKFVIKTISGDTEYVVEIPNAAAEYEVMVPLALANNGQTVDRKLSKVRNPQLTDRELIAQFPSLDAATEEERMLLDKAFGVSEEGGPRQAPSYSVGLAKLNQLYRKREYELALIEVNNLLAFYPTSARLYKMKGTILRKTDDLRLAEKAWIRASELAPSDPVIKRGLLSLRRRIEERRMSSPVKSQNRVAPATSPNAQQPVPPQNKQPLSAPQ